MAAVLAAYERTLAAGEIKPDALQKAAAQRLDDLAQALAQKPAGFSLFRRPPPPPRGLYLWGDVGRGKTMLMDLFFAAVPLASKRRAHFNSFMLDTHARIHAMRQQAGVTDPIAPVARALADSARLLCFDEFQVTDVADAMILGRLFEALLAEGVTIVATSNTAPEHLYEGGLNRQLFLPFIAEIRARLDVVELNGATDYRMERTAGIPTWLSPLSDTAEAAMNQAWQDLTGTRAGRPVILTVLGRKLVVPQAARGAARFGFADLCEQPLGAGDYLAIAREFHTVLVDHVPLLTADMRNEARRFILLIDTLYDEGVALIASAEGAPEALYPEGGPDAGLRDAFRRTVSRLAEMQSEDYLKQTCHQDGRS
ncbi:MAG: cell division protein ZapE [Alphaproteobacteria bacterium]|nr:cell division protein ZapE [Alphaproteobacteria bacterium]